MFGFVYNEYVHEHLKFESTECVYFIYEPFENTPTHNVRGTIYVDGEPTQHFHQDGLQLILTEGIAADAQLLDRRTISMRWPDNPGEHFLCVSYNFGQETESTEKTNWLEEGF